MCMNKWVKKKNKKKIFRTIFECLILSFIVITLLRTFFAEAQYQPFDEKDTAIVNGKDHGFIAISYMGVDRRGNNSLISEGLLKNQLQALKDLGYVTITQKDILAYYQEGKKLPEKSLYLIFEDGRRDTALFSQKILEDLNFKATISSYANHFQTRDDKFLTGEELLSMEQSSFWENASNGYRLSYINVFDRYKEFLGQLTAKEYNEIKPYLSRNYNHYLMDFIRDQDEIPIESYEEMKARLTGDYDLMKEGYLKNLGYIPKTYLLMHANTKGYGNHEKVSKINENCMKELFAMNFNGEGFAKNNSETDLYQLTRLQSQAYWPTNHLLMRIWDDLEAHEKNQVHFVDGNAGRKKDWDTLEGASEFQQNSIILTSEPKSSGLLKLKGERPGINIALQTTLLGNQSGRQTIYLRADEELNNGIAISIEKKKLQIQEGNKEIANIDLDKLKGVEFDSVEEDKKAALVKEYHVRAKGAENIQQCIAYETASNDIKKMEARSVKEGAESYIPEVQLSDQGCYQLDISLEEDEITVTIDDCIAVDHLKLKNIEEGAIYLEASCLEENKSQKNIVDDVYDAIFEDLVVTEISNGKEKIIYDNRLQSLERVISKTGEGFDSLIDWFVVNL